MSKFVLTAQLQLQAPNNVGQVVQQIQNQLGGVKVNIQAQGTAQAQQQVQQLTKSMTQATGAASNLGRAFAMSVKRFTAFAVATRAVSLFTNTLSSSIEEAISFERQLVKISQVTGTAINELGGLVGEVDKLSKTLGVSSKSLLNVSEILAQAGLSANDTKIALNALALTELAPTFDNITATAEGAVAILAQFKEGSAALEGQLGSLNAVAGKFAVEAGDLVDVIRRTGGVFKASGGNLNELIALFTSVRATTRESAESISTGLRTIFTRIQRPKTIEFLKQFGVELTDLEGKFVGPYEAIRRLSEGLRGLGEGDITFIKIAEELGGFRQIGKVIPLLREFKISQEALNVAQKGSKGLAQDAATAQLALAIRITKVKEEFLSLVRSITETKSFQVFANTALNLASSLIKLADALSPIIPLLTAVASIKIAQNIGNFIGGFKGGLGSKKTFSDGGRVHRFATGGLVPGNKSSSGDSVKALLSPREYVLDQDTTARIGVKDLEHINNGGTLESVVQRKGGGKIQRFAYGGQARKFGIAALSPLDKPLQEEKATIPIPNIRKYLSKKAGSQQVIKSGNIENVDNTIRGILGLKGQQSVKTSAIAETISRQDVSNKIEKRVELSIQKLIDNAATTLGKSLSINVERKADNAIVKSVGSASTIGSVFEGALSMLGAPMDSSKSEQDPIDFPYGIGEKLSSTFQSLSGIPVDAKKTATKKILKDTASRKAASYLANAVYADGRWQTLSQKTPSEKKPLTQKVKSPIRIKTIDPTKLTAFTSGTTYSYQDLGKAGIEPAQFTQAFDKLGQGMWRKKSIGGVIQKFAGGSQVKPVSEEIKDDRIRLKKKEVIPQITANLQKPFDRTRFYQNIKEKLKRDSLIDRISDFAKFIGLPQQDLSLILPQVIDFASVQAGPTGRFSSSGIGMKDVEGYDRSQGQTPSDIRAKIEEKAKRTGRGAIFLNTNQYSQANTGTLYHEMTHQLLQGLMTRSSQSFEQYKQKVVSLFELDNNGLSDAFDALGSTYNSADVVYGRRYKISMLDNAIKKNRGSDKVAKTPTATREAYDLWSKSLPIKTAREFKLINPSVNKALLDNSYSQEYISQKEDAGKQEFLTTLVQKSPELNSHLQSILNDTLTSLLGSAGIQRQQYAEGGVVQRFAGAGKVTPSKPSKKQKISKQEKEILSIWEKVQKFTGLPLGTPLPPISFNKDEPSQIFGGISAVTDVLANENKIVRQAFLDTLDPGWNPNTAPKINVNPSDDRKLTLAHELTHYALQKMDPKKRQALRQKIWKNRKPLGSFLEDRSKKNPNSYRSNIFATDVHKLPRTYGAYFAGEYEDAIQRIAGQGGVDALHNAAKLVAQEEAAVEAASIFLIEGDKKAGKLAKKIGLGPKQKPLKASRKNIGGILSRFMAGGSPDSYSDNTVPALVSNGEGYVSPELAQRIGYGKLALMNRADTNGMGKFAEGGVPNGISIFDGPGTDTSDSIRVNLPVNSFILRGKATKALGLKTGGKVSKFANGGSVKSPQKFVSGGDVIGSSAAGAAKIPNIFKPVESVFGLLGKTAQNTIKSLTDYIGNVNSNTHYLGRLGPGLEHVLETLEANAKANNRSAINQADVIVKTADLADAIAINTNEYGFNSKQQHEAANAFLAWIASIEEDTKAKQASASSTSAAATTATATPAVVSPKSQKTLDAEAKKKALQEAGFTKGSVKSALARPGYEEKQLAKVKTVKRPQSFRKAALEEFQKEGYQLDATGKNYIQIASGKTLSQKELDVRAGEMRTQYRRDKDIEIGTKKKIKLRASAARQELAASKELAGIVSRRGGGNPPPVPPGGGGGGGGGGPPPVPPGGGGGGGGGGPPPVPPGGGGGGGGGGPPPVPPGGGGGGKQSQNADGSRGLTGMGKMNEALFGLTYALSSLTPVIDENSTSFQKGMAKTIESLTFFSSIMMGVSAATSAFGGSLNKATAGNALNFLSGGKFGSTTNALNKATIGQKAANLMTANPKLSKFSALKQAAQTTPQGGSIASQVGNFVGAKTGSSLAGRAAQVATRVVGPAVAVTAIVGALNSVVGNFRDLDGALERAVKSGNEVAISNAAMAKAASNFPIVGNLISAFWGEAGDAFLVGVSTFFGGQSADQIKTAALSQAEAGKAAKSLADATTKATKAMKDFEDGNASALDVVKASAGGMEGVQKFKKATENQITANENTKSTSDTSSVLRSVGSILTLGYVQTSGQRNAGIDKQNETLRQEVKTKESEAFQVALPGLEILQKQVAATGGSFNDFIDKIKSTGKAGKALAAYINQEGANALGLSKSFENIAKEAERTRKAFDAMNLGFQNVSAASVALGVNLDNYLNTQEAGYSRTENTMRTLEASITNAAQGISDSDFGSALGDASNSLRQLGASDSQIKKFEENLGAINTAQKFFASASEETKNRLKAEFERGAGTAKTEQERRGVFSDVIGKQLEGAGIGKEVRGRIKDALANAEISNTDMQAIMAGDFSRLDAILKDLGQTTLKDVIPALQQKAKYEKVLVDLAQKRIESENKVIEAQRGVLEAQLEAQEIISKYGGKQLTPEMRAQNAVAQANVQASGVKGISQLTTGSAAELQQRSGQIKARLAEINQIRSSNALGNKGAKEQMAGPEGKALEGERQRLLDLAKSDYDTTKKLIAIKEDEIKLIGEKNKLEKDSIDALIGGDIDKFFEMQQAEGAKAAIATGNVALQSAYGATALGTAAQDIKRQQEAGQTSLFGQDLAGPNGLTERGYGAALGARGITGELNARMAQTAAGTTAEEEIKKAEIRGLAGTLPNNAETQLQNAQSDKEAADLQYRAAEMQLEAAVQQVNARGGGAMAGQGETAMFRAMGGLIYANRGIFVPRGTDTVPAMLTPGEFVVNRAAVQRGNNLQVLQAMNRGSNNSSSAQGDGGDGGSATGMSRGGMVSYYNRGGRVRYFANAGMVDEAGGGTSGGSMNLDQITSALNSFNAAFSANIDKLKNTSLSVKLDTANVNVNLNDGGILQKLTQESQDKVIGSVIDHLKNKMSVRDGRLVDNTSTINK